METTKTFDPGIHINELHQDHKDWIQELEFYKLEISFFQQMLEDFARTKNDGSQNAAIEQFQNKLILQNEQTEILLHDTHKQEAKLGNFVKTHENTLESVTFKDHTKWREKMNTHRKLYAEMKREFYHGITPSTAN
jgi:hypothetical protein